MINKYYRRSVIQFNAFDANTYQQLLIREKKYTLFTLNIYTYLCITNTYYYDHKTHVKH